MVKTGETVQVVDVKCSYYVKKKLSTIGFNKGAILTVIRIAPFGGPVEIKLLDFYFALRKEDTKYIMVKKYE
ncbi:MAG: FeoA domain-containing protein [Clostridia bacterium]|nr:FeoA domain-containing protein [Clostridia bacterium]